jgi:hypothetical protein
MRNIGCIAFARSAGQAMVPLADMFNHKAAIVHRSGGYTIAENDDVSCDDEPCDEDAAATDVPELALQAGPSLKRLRPTEAGPLDEDVPAIHQHDAGPYHKISANAMLEFDEGNEEEELRLGEELEEESDDDDGVAANAEDEQFHGSFPDANLRLEMAICDETELGEHGQKREVLHIIAAQDIVAGKEVHNTYGEHGNDDLLLKYGFALRENIFHAVAFHLDEVRGALEGVRGMVGKSTMMMLEQFLMREMQEMWDGEQEEAAHPNAFQVYGAGFVSGELSCVLALLSAHLQRTSSMGVADWLQSELREHSTAFQGTTQLLYYVQNAVLSLM